MKFRVVTFLSMVIFFFLGMQEIVGQVSWSDSLKEVIVLLDQAPLVSEETISGDKISKGRQVFSRLREHSGISQEPLVRFLSEHGLYYHSFYLVNAVFTRANKDQIRKIETLPGVSSLLENRRMQLEQTIEVSPGHNSRNFLPWGLTTIQADKVWEMGYRGQAVIIGGHDTGVEWQHPALLGNYRGYSANGADHAYNWFDAIHEISALHGDSVVNGNENPCGLNLREPCDDIGSSHGTHTLGTALGYDRSSGQIVGVAPEATWVAVRCMERGYGSIASYLEGFQWFLAPTDLEGKGPDPDRSPHVIINSWACIEKEGCNPGNFEILEMAVRHLRAAGIVVVTSAGNSGSGGCGTVEFPIAIYEESFTVGSTDQSDTLSSFSSRGPVIVDQSNRLKPDITAPGRGILSSIKGQNYGMLSGTSMAGPHVAGLVALIISANPALAGNVQEIENIIRKTAVPLFAPETSTCSTPGGTIVPNSLYGHGRIDARAAVEKALEFTTGLGEVNNSDEFSIYPNPVNSLLFLEWESTQPVDISVINYQGQLILQKKITGMSTGIETGNWPTGPYIVRLSCSHFTSTRKILVFR